MSTSTTFDFRSDLLAGKLDAAPLQPRAARATLQSDDLQPATHVHPLAVGAAAVGYAWFLLVCWVVFAADSQMVAALLMVTFISAVMIGMPMALGSSARNVVPWMRAGRSWADFLDGRVDTFTGPMSGRAVFTQLAGMSGVLALGATALGIIIACSR